MKKFLIPAAVLIAGNFFANNAAAEVQPLVSVVHEDIKFSESVYRKKSRKPLAFAI